jgi:hypothetical protein
MALWPYSGNPYLRPMYSVYSELLYLRAVAHDLDCECNRLDRLLVGRDATIKTLREELATAEAALAKSATIEAERAKLSRCNITLHDCINQQLSKLRLFNDTISTLSMQLADEGRTRTKLISESAEHQAHIQGLKSWNQTLQDKVEETYRNARGQVDLLAEELRRTYQTINALRANSDEPRPDTRKQLRHFPRNVEYVDRPVRISQPGLEDTQRSQTLMGQRGTTAERPRNRSRHRIRDYRKTPTKIEEAVKAPHFIGGPLSMDSATQAPPPPPTLPKLDVERAGFLGGKAISDSDICEPWQSLLLDVDRRSRWASRGEADSLERSKTSHVGVRAEYFFCPRFYCPGGREAILDRDDLAKHLMRDHGESFSAAQDTARSILPKRN